MTSLNEKCVGITQFVGNHTGFFGIVKLRFQDFLVNEISSTGNVARLTTFSPPSKPVECKDDVATLPDVIEPADKLLLDALYQNNKDSPDHVLIKTDCDKSVRTEIHKTIRIIYPGLESSTIDDEKNGNKMIKVCRSKPGRQDRRRHEKKTYCKFVMHKQNIATSAAINLITSKLSLKHSKAFQYAGNKDKQGITVQEVTTALPYERLAFLANPKGKIVIGNFTLGAQPLRLGSLTGNYFSMIVRNIKDAEESDISASVQSFQKHGFINYFGMQRFGASTVPTYEIGKSILGRKWEQVVDQILSAVHSGLQADAVATVKNWKEDGHAEKLLKTLDRKHSLERQLLQGIQKFGPTQLVQALTFMPRNVRTMYLHSYQSLVWNKVASKRIHRYGLAPVVGDLVLLNPSENLESQDDDGEPPAKKQRKEAVAGVKRLTAGDLPSYSITDVVLPLPGHCIVYPAYEPDCWYEQILREDGIKNSDLEHRVKEYSLPGAYRKLLVKPDTVEWDVLRYKDFETPLLVSDLERMEGKVEPQCEDGPFQALRIKFSLPASSYATMALREVLKQDLSMACQLSLSEQHKAEVRRHLAVVAKSEPDDT